MPIKNTIQHYSQSELEAIQADFDALKNKVRHDANSEEGLEESRKYVLKVTRTIKTLNFVGKVLIVFSFSFAPLAYLLGIIMIGLNRNIEYCFGHNVLHKQYDSLKDPLAHSSTWKFKYSVIEEKEWASSHNKNHHQFAGVIGKDLDTNGYGVRLSKKFKWKPYHLSMPLLFVFMAPFFSFLLAFHVSGIPRKWFPSIFNETIVIPEEEYQQKKSAFWKKVLSVYGRDYGWFPLLTGPFFVTTWLGMFFAEIVSSLILITISTPQHSTEDSVLFDEGEIDNKGNRGAWYVSQILTTNNYCRSFPSGFLFGDLMSNHLEHHLFPTLPSYRLQRVEKEVEALCHKHQIPYVRYRFFEGLWMATKNIFQNSFPDPVLR